MSDALLVLLGGLYIGAEWLVRGASGLVSSLGVRPLVIGLTVVAYGTSAPELVVGVGAALSHKGAIAFGNSVGSNIANLGLILGITAIIAPPKVDPNVRRRELPVLAASTLAIPVVLLDGTISRLEADRLLFVESPPRATPREFQRIVRVHDLRTRGSPKFVNAIEWRAREDSNL